MNTQNWSGRTALTSHSFAAQSTAVVPGCRSRLPFRRGCPSGHRSAAVALLGAVPRRLPSWPQPSRPLPSTPFPALRAPHRAGHPTRGVRLIYGLRAPLVPAVACGRLPFLQNPFKSCRHSRVDARELSSTPQIREPSPTRSWSRPRHEGGRSAHPLSDAIRQTLGDCPGDLRNSQGSTGPRRPSRLRLAGGSVQK